MTPESKPRASRRKEPETTAMGDWTTVVDAVMSEVDPGRAAPAQAAPPSSPEWKLSLRHHQFIETLIGATKSKNAEAQQRVHSSVMP
jgi:hypothetical protein